MSGVEMNVASAEYSSERVTNEQWWPSPGKMY